MDVKSWISSFIESTKQKAELSQLSDDELKARRRMAPVADELGVRDPSFGNTPEQHALELDPSRGMAWAEQAVKFRAADAYHDMMRELGEKLPKGKEGDPQLQALMQALSHPPVTGVPKDVKPPVPAQQLAKGGKIEPANEPMFPPAEVIPLKPEPKFKPGDAVQLRDDLNLDRYFSIPESKPGAGDAMENLVLPDSVWAIVDTPNLSDAAKLNRLRHLAQKGVIAKRSIRGYFNIMKWMKPGDGEHKAKGGSVRGPGQRRPTLPKEGYAFRDDAIAATEQIRKKAGASRVAYKNKQTGEVIVGSALRHNEDDIPNDKWVAHGWEYGFVTKDGTFLSREDLDEFARLNEENKFAHGGKILEFPKGKAGIFSDEQLLKELEEAVKPKHEGVTYEAGHYAPEKVKGKKKHHLTVVKAQGGAVPKLEQEPSPERLAYNEERLKDVILGGTRVKAIRELPSAKFKHGGAGAYLPDQRVIMLNSGSKGLARLYVMAHEAAHTMTEDEAEAWKVAETLLMKAGIRPGNYFYQRRDKSLSYQHKAQGGYIMGPTAEKGHHSYCIAHGGTEPCRHNNCCFEKFLEGQPMWSNEPMYAEGGEVELGDAFAYSHEDETHHHVRHPDGRMLKIPKKGAAADLLAAMPHLPRLKMAEGGAAPDDAAAAAEIEKLGQENPEPPPVAENIIGKGLQSAWEAVNKPISPQTGPDLSTYTTDQLKKLAGKASPAAKKVIENELKQREGTPQAASPAVAPEVPAAPAKPEAPPVDTTTDVKEPELGLNIGVGPTPTAPTGAQGGPGPQGGGPSTAGGWRPTGIPAMALEGIEEQVSGTAGVGEVVGRQALARQQVRETAAQNYQQIQDHLETNFNGFQSAAKAVGQDLLAEPLRPFRVWQDASTPKKVGVGISMLLGGISSGLVGGANPGWAMFDSILQKDIESQKTNIETKKNLMRMFMDQGLNEIQSAQAAFAIQKMAVAERVAATSDMWGDELAKNQAKIGAGKYHLEGATTLLNLQGKAYENTVKAIQAWEAEQIQNIERGVFGNIRAGGGGPGFNLPALNTLGALKPGNPLSGMATNTFEYTDADGKNQQIQVADPANKAQLQEAASQRDQAEYFTKRVGEISEGAGWRHASNQLLLQNLGPQVAKVGTLALEYIIGRAGIKGAIGGIGEHVDEAALKSHLKYVQDASARMEKILKDKFNTNLEMAKAKQLETAAQMAGLKLPPGVRPLTNPGELRDMAMRLREPGVADEIGSAFSTAAAQFKTDAQAQLEAAAASMAKQQGIPLDVAKDYLMGDLWDVKYHGNARMKEYLNAVNHDFHNRLKPLGGKYYPTGKE